MADHLLPPNATQAEVSLSLATARILDVPILVRESWNPDECPPELLPWLAWAHSVDEWDNSWTIDQKRAAINASVYIHRHKGTVGAVKRAVGLVFDDAQVEQWFEYDGRPFYFRITTSGSFTSEDEYRRLIRLVESAKNKRSWLEAIIIKSRIDMQLYVGSYMAIGTSTWMWPRAPITELDRQQINFGSAFHRATTTTVHEHRLSIIADSLAAYFGSILHRSQKTTIRPAGRN